MKKTILLALIVLFGCGGQNGDDYPITDKDFQKGTDGLVYEFIPGGPPPSVFETTEFEVAAEMWNKGAYEIKNAYSTLNLETDYLCVAPNGDCVNTAGGGRYNQDLTLNLMSIGANPEFKGRSVSFPEGTSKYVVYQVKAKDMDPLTEQHTTPVLLHFP